MGIDVAQVLAIGGPSGVIGAIIVVAVNAYLSIRKDRREGKKDNIDNQGGMVNNAKQVLDLVTSASDRMEKRMVILEESNRKLNLQINDRDDTIARQKRAVDFLTEDLARAQSRIQYLEREDGGAA